MKINECIKCALDESGLSNDDFAKKLNVNTETLKGFISGEIDPHKDVEEKLSDMFPKWDTERYWKTIDAYGKESLIICD